MEMGREYIRYEEEVVTWRTVAVAYYCLRNPGFADLPKIDPRDYTPFLRWGQELDILEHDLTECANEFILSSRSFYREASELNVRRFVVLYHVDNFNVRLHKLVDNLYRLVSLTEEGADLPAYPVLSEVRRRLTEFKQAMPVRSALDDRKRFVHEYRELPAGKGWDLFAPAVRLESISDPDEEMTRHAMDTGPIDEFARRKISEFREMLDLVCGLRNSCFDCLASAVVERASEVASRKDHFFVQLFLFYLELGKE